LPEVPEYDISEDEEFHWKQENSEPARKVRFSVTETPINVVETMTSRAPRAKARSSAPKTKPPALPSKTGFRTGVRGAPESPLKPTARSTPSSRSHSQLVMELSNSASTSSDSTKRPPLRASMLTSPPPTALSPVSTTGPTQTKRRRRRTKASRSKRPASSKVQNPHKKN
jgi:hypothetical protein